MGGTDTLISIENVRGSDFDDFILGSDDLGVRQFLAGDAGNDFIDGGAGVDLASYSGNALSLGGITAFVENGSGTVQDKMGGTDTLVNIEGIRGTHAADNLSGGAGDQWFQGRGSSDTINGGSGGESLGDWVSYSGDPTGVFVNLSGNAVTVNSVTVAANSAVDGWNGPSGLLALGGTDSLTNIENAEGSSYNDVLVGNASDNTLMGRGGNDTLLQTVGADTLDGGSGTDTLSFAQTGVSYGVAAGVTVSFLTGLSDLNNQAAGANSLIISIETVIGTAGNDVFTGGDPTHARDGQGNNITETFRGNGGNDTITGGDGGAPLIE
jgi:Ca2+-binding RTX toxin-like protein